jgi:uncharacterized protein with FMN-binding domain
MAFTQPVRATDIAQSVKKLLLTSAVVVSFAAYAAYEHFAAPPDAPVVAARVFTGTGPAGPNTPARTGAGTVQTPTAGANTGAVATQPTAKTTPAPAGVRATPTRAPQVVVRPTATPPPAQVAGAYKDGVYTGDSKNAYYGNVQVKAVIKGGQLADVQFVDYPHDRRTSQRINDYAMPYLQSEAIQAQSAQVDIISGATLTSEAYVRSLQSALLKAKS